MHVYSLITERNEKLEALLYGYLFIFYEQLILFNNSSIMYAISGFHSIVPRSMPLNATCLFFRFQSNAFARQCQTL